ncbi:ParB/RepB/Spo0J family partition protein [Dickeya ananatis]|uniref:ParB/RepB/Spo0J family partition protein n=1 Tax=Dickeya ananatis TaxID=3061286 RepID=UPI00388D6106
MQPEETFKPVPITMIEIKKIKFLNPRTRSKVIHDQIKDSIKKRGLTKPITVRKIIDDEFGYALICGQGRIEALIGLGEEKIPAIIRDVSEEDAYIMSLVENIARRRPRSNELLQIIKNMKVQGMTDGEIGEITGYSSHWVNRISMLLDKGEHKLLSAVERGTIPLYLAVEFSRCNSIDAQNILSEAYEKKIIKSGDVIKIRHMLNQRNEGKKGNKTSGFIYNKKPQKPSLEKLKELYENSIAEHKSVYNHAELIKNNLLVINEIFNNIMKKDSFIDLLSSEGLSNIPSQILTPIRVED